MQRVFDTFFFTLERTWQHRVLVLWVLLGISVATTLAISLPLYVDSVYTELLESRLDVPPYAFRFRYLGAWNGNIQQVDFDSASAAIGGEFTGTIGLATGRAGSGNVVAATGVRGLDEEDLKEAEFNGEELHKLKSYAASEAKARKYAGKAGLKSIQVEFIAAAKK